MKAKDDDSPQNIQSVNMKRRSNQSHLIEQRNYENQSDNQSADQSYTNITMSQARSTLMDYPEDDTLYNFMKDELDHIMTSAQRQAQEFFNLSVEKLKEKERTLIKYYEKKLLLVSVKFVSI